MINVGLTGGIGSGKSLVAELFEHLGIPVYSADQRAKWLMNNDEELKQSIQSTFGESSYQNEQLDRAYMAERVFKSPSELEKLNALVHPAVRKDYLNWAGEQEAPYNIREAAILFESGAYVDCDKIITVNAPESVRIDRVVKRDQVDEEAAQDRMKNQLSDEERSARSDYIINNDGQEMILPQVLEIHESILNASKAS